MHIKSDNIRLLLQKVMLLTIYIQTKALKSPDYTNKIGYFRPKKHQPYKQILIVYMAGYKYVIVNLSLNTRPR